MGTFNEAAQSYFGKLWTEAKQSWMTGAVKAAEMKDGKSIPIDYCLSTVARLSKQQVAPVASIKSVVEEIRDVAQNQFVYPAESRHITLLGCTQRAPLKDDFSIARRNEIFATCKRVISGQGVVKMFVKGVGIVGNQVFLQVFPTDDKWAQLRFELAKALEELGENPITFPNMSPIHLNIMRITNSSQHQLITLLKTIERLHELAIGPLEITEVDYLLTDFVLSDARENLGTISLVG